MNSMTIGIELLAFSLFDYVEILKVSCHSRKIMVKMRNLFLKFEVPLIFCVMPIIFCLLVYQETKPYEIWWKKPKKSTYWDLIGVVWHTILGMRDKKHLFAYCVTCGTFMYLVR
jgi:hypothetical protein